MLSTPAQGAITFFGMASSPADGGAQSGAAERTVTPPASMLTNDYVLVMVSGIGNDGATPPTLTNTTTGGQTWTGVTQVDQSGNGLGTRLFHARYNGTWAADPGFTATVASGNSFSIVMLVFRGVDTTTALDVAVAGNAYSACTSACTITGVTTNSSGAAVIAWWIANNTTTFTLTVGPGWTQNQSRVLNTTGIDNVQSYAWLIPVNSAASGDVTNVQGTSRAGVEYILALKAAVTARPMSPIFFH